MRKMFVALAFGALLISGKAFSLGLGEIEVNSALNQEFDAEIELMSAAPEDVETLIVKLASREEFSRAGIDRPYSLTDLRFSPQVKDGRPVIVVSSGKPVREPYLDFLIEVDWPKGHLVREYTVLLDPPVFLGQEAAISQSRPAMQENRPAPAPTVTAPSDARPAVSGRPASAPMPAPTPAPASAPEPESDAGDSMRPAQRDSSAAASVTEPYEPEQYRPAAEPAPVAAAPVTRQSNQYRPPPDGYRIQKGDTLWSLADAMRPDRDVSIQQMMLALLRSNPEAFIEENINGLKRGYILRVPDRAYIENVDREQALAEVQQHHGLWREYQAKLSGKPLPAPDVEAGPEPETEAGTEFEAETAMADDSEQPEARLEISSAGTGAGVAGSDKDPSEMTEDELRAQLALAEEQLESERLQKEGMEGEVAALEGKVEKMKRLLAIEDDTLAELQASATPEQGEVDTDEEQVMEGEAEMVAESEMMDEMLEEMPAEMLDETSEGVEEMADEASEEIEAITEEPDTLAEAPVTEVEPMPQEPSQDAFRPEVPQNPLLRLMDNPIVLSGVGALLLLIMLLTYILVKRKRAASEEQATAQAAFDSDLEGVADLVDDTTVSAEVSDEEVEQEMAEATAGAEDEGLDEIDTESTMVLSPEEDTVVTEAQTGADESEEDEPRDDVIAEADVYLAYGIYQQAEELLQKAINDNPERDEYRAKLAETHFAAKNAGGFTAVARELHQRLGGQETPLWLKVAAMGKELCPDEDLFKGGTVPDMPVDELVPSPEPMDFDLGEEAGEAEAGGDDELSLPDTDTSELEFDLGDIDAEGETGAAPAEQAPAAETDDLDLELDTSALDIGEPEQDTDTASAEDDAGELEFDLSEEAADMDFDTGTEEGLDLDLGSAEEDKEEGLDLDLGSAEDDKEEDKDESGVDMQLDAADLELDTESTMVISADEDESAGSDDDEEIDFSDLSDVDEVATKLDLARAYLDMGDNEGTKSILEEVLADGNEEQKKDAEELLKQIDG